MKVALFKNFNLAPLKVKNLFTSNNIRSRLIDISDPDNYFHKLNELAIDWPTDIADRMPLLLSHRRDGTVIKRIISIEENDYSYLIYSDIDMTWYIKIIEVDITRPWTLKTRYEYDDEDDEPIETMDYIKYLDYIVSDALINYCIEIDSYSNN